MQTTSASYSTPPNVEPVNAIVLPNGREALVTTRVETSTESPLAALLQVDVGLGPSGQCNAVI